MHVSKGSPSKDVKYILHLSFVKLKTEQNKKQTSKREYMFQKVI